MRHTKANYGRRVVAYLIDVALTWLLPIVVTIFGVAFLFADSSRGLGVVLVVVSLFWPLVVGILNAVVRQGTKGATIGKSAMGLSLIKEETGAPVGVGYALLRVFLGWLLGTVTSGIFTIVDLIFPAIDDKGQRVLDKMLKTIVIDGNPGRAGTGGNPRPRERNIFD
jgi:uncharacterized RDD family membrane protein YckC